MKILHSNPCSVALACLLWTCTVPAMAVDVAPPSLQSVDRDLDDLADRIRDVQDRIAAVETRIDEIEKRLGQSFGPSTPFNTVERRLDDIEDEIDRLKRP